MNGLSYLELFKLVSPEAIVVVAALAVLAVDLFAMREEPTRNRLLVGAMFTCLGCIVAVAWTATVRVETVWPAGVLAVSSDPLTRLVKQALLALTAFTALIATEADFTDHVGEYFVLLLLATVGMMFLVSAEDLLMIFLSLELTSLPLYVLAAFNKRNSKSAEAALKYFLFGGMAAAFTLFGLSLLYGITGSIELRQVAIGLKGHALDPLFLAALLMTMIGFGFKVAAVPFHLWAPDVYQGAPTPAAALIASGSKVASFFILAKLLIVGFGGTEGSGAWRAFATGWVPVLAVLAVLSMLLGNLAAIAQRGVKRLLAYSAIAHAGYMLLGVLAHDRQGVSSLVYYVVTYGLTTVGAFGVVTVVQEQTGDDRLDDFAGLSRRAPVLSLCLMIFMLSLAGIPPLAGFFGKFYLFTAAAGADPTNLGLLWLVIFAIAMSAVSLYYYLQVLKQVYVKEAAADAPALRVAPAALIALVLLAAGVLVLGALPDLVVGKLMAVIGSSGF
ncbi:MAG: NADH-quinone oxidoreductase subunit N [Verrucomicrobia bacterium]|nr:NADH-quinone oxidoreductase subunit N [Verrucomicrobiota bacterium]